MLVFKPLYNNVESYRLFHSTIRFLELWLKETRFHQKSMTDSPLATWDMTLSKEFCSDYMCIIRDLESISKKWVFQEELSENGYEHFQIRFSLIKKKRKSALVKLLQETEGLQTGSVSPTSNAGVGKGFQYTMKLDTRVAGPWADTDPEPQFIQRSTLRIKELYPWQKRVEASTKVEELRKVNILMDASGNTGKSTLVKVLEARRLAVKLPLTRDYKDIIQMAHGIAVGLTRKDTSLGCFMVDMPRGIAKKDMAGFYSAIETLKDGNLFDMRYKFNKYMIDEPVVWIFTNQLPDLELLSRDRWVIWEIDQSTNDLVDVTANAIPGPNDSSVVVVDDCPFDGRDPLSR